jgi:type III restriction enzyme
MHFRFDANQEYQLQAIAAVVDLFEGQPRVEKDLRFELGASFAAVPNRLELEDDALLANLTKVQARNRLTPDKILEVIEEAIPGIAGPRQAKFANFSVEMETGTGKTYVYIRTALELYQHYGMRKFVIVVPSIAIREGVLKTFEMTRTHLRNLCQNAPYRFYVYDSASLAQVKTFAASDGVEFMVMTIDSFNKASNVLRQVPGPDRLQGETPLYMVQAARPILILDEPQNMESELSVRSLAALDPLFALRYSATHRNPYNLVFRLTPFEAYRQGLVKRIEVAGVEQMDDANLPFLRLDGIRVEKSKLTARIAVQKLMADRTVKEKVVVVRPDSDLKVLAGRDDYAGFTVDEITSRYVRFANGHELKPGESLGADREAIFAVQIEDTIREHFHKQRRLKEKGIKVLSLFFIDRVDNYQREDGLIRRLFEQTFDRLKREHPDWRDAKLADVQAAYFAQRRHRGGETELQDSTSGKSKADEEAYDLIMKDKESLLSFPAAGDSEEARRRKQVSFIFSHSALREGWDNPNVFQICTLNQTASEIKKRQEVGRGVRLAVNQQGERVRDEDVNVLTVIANESYEKYVDSLQRETEEEYGKEGLPPRPPNARRRATAKLRKGYLLKPEFKELWERIKHKTRYAVRIDSGRLISEVIAELDQAVIRKPRIAITKVELKAEKGDAGDEFRPLVTSGAKTLVDLSGRYPLPNLIAKMSELLEGMTPPVRLTRNTLAEVYRRTRQQQAALDNPQEFAATAVRIIADKLAQMLVDGIRYEKLGEWYEATQFEAELEAWADYLVPVKAASLYDHVLFESDIEKKFCEDLDNWNQVRLYVKLPKWFKVETPVGEYNPDWAIVFEPRDSVGEATGERLLYLVRETKDPDWPAGARREEEQKVKCGKAHFRDALGTDFKVVSRASELR